MSYRLSQKRFYCYQCKQEFKSLYAEGQDVSCDKCHSPYVELMTSNQHRFEPYVIPREEESKEVPLIRFMEILEPGFITMPMPLSHENVKVPATKKAIENLKRLPAK